MRELMGMLLDIFYDIDTRGEPKKKKKNIPKKQSLKEEKIYPVLVIPIQNLVWFSVSSPINNRRSSKKSNSVYSTNKKRKRQSCLWNVFKARHLLLFHLL